MTVETLIATIVASVSFIGMVTTFVLSLKNNRRNDNQELVRQVEESTKMNTKLDMINQSTLKIESSIQKVSDKVEEHGKQIVILDATVKALHKRVDHLEGKI